MHVSIVKVNVTRQLICQSKSPIWTDQWLKRFYNRSSYARDIGCQSSNTNPDSPCSLWRRRGIATRNPAFTFFWHVRVKSEPRLCHWLIDHCILWKLTDGDWPRVPLQIDLFSENGASVCPSDGLNVQTGHGHRIARKEMDKFSALSTFSKFSSRHSLSSSRQRRGPSRNSHLSFEQN